MDAFMTRMHAPATLLAYLQLRMAPCCCLCRPLYPIPGLWHRLAVLYRASCDVQVLAQLQAAACSPAAAPVANGRSALESVPAPPAGAPAGPVAGAGALLDGSAAFGTPCAPPPVTAPARLCAAGAAPACALPSPATTLREGGWVRFSAY